MHRNKLARVSWSVLQHQRPFDTHLQELPAILDPRPVNVNRLISDMEELIRRTIGPTIDLEVVGGGGRSAICTPRQGRHWKPDR